MGRHKDLIAAGERLEDSDSDTSFSLYSEPEQPPFHISRKEPIKRGEYMA